MAISKKDVEYIANLARLELTAKEIDHFQAQLENILGYIDKLKEADISGVGPMAGVFDLKNVFRPDEKRPSIDPKSVLGAAPAASGQFFKVPKVIE